MANKAIHSGTFCDNKKFLRLRRQPSCGRCHALFISPVSDTWLVSDPLWSNNVPSRFLILQCSAQYLAHSKGSINFDLNWVCLRINTHCQKLDQPLPGNVPFLESQILISLAAHKHLSFYFLIAKLIFFTLITSLIPQFFLTLQVLIFLLVLLSYLPAWTSWLLLQLWSHQWPYFFNSPPPNNNKSGI